MIVVIDQTKLMATTKKEQESIKGLLRSEGAEFEEVEVGNIVFFNVRNFSDGASADYIVAELKKQGADFLDERLERLASQVLKEDGV